MLFLKSFFKSLILASFVTMIVGFTLYSRVGSTEVDVAKLKEPPQPTIIYDKNGNQLAKFMKERKDDMKYEDIPKEMEHALLATEDRDFYEHMGVNPKAILRAAIHDIKVGSFEQGGSTITQQLVKNTYLTSGKTLERKQKEAIYAAAIEKEFSKKEILTFYLNSSDFVYNSFGIRNAIETYYGQTLEQFKQDSRVDRIAKSAMLMGLLQSPSEFNPFVHPDKALARRNLVIHNMKVENHITKDEYDKAIKKPLMILDQPKYVHDDEKMMYPEFVSYVLEEIRQQYKLDKVEDAKYIGMNVYTSFDPKVYEIIRKHMQRADLYPSDASDGTQVQGSIAIVNPKNGEIYALTGGRQQPGFLEFNRAYQNKRQPGSTFKPIISYAPAIESGKFTPWSVLPDDQSIDFGGGYTVRNFGGKQYGSLQMAEALRMSENVPAVYLLQQTGIENAKKFAKKQGIEFGKEDKYLPIALGGLSIGVNSLDMADSYQGFANGGYRIPAHTIRKIVNHDGKVEYEAPKKVTEDFRTMKKETAKYMKYMLRNAVENGTGTKANVEGHFIAGKTGTAEYPGIASRNRDIWFTGFSDTFVASVWMGFDSPSPDRSLKDTSWVTAQMFGEIAKELVKVYPSPLNNYETPEEAKPKVEEMKLEGKYEEADNKISLWWEGPKDSIYKIYRNGELLHETDWKTFENITITAGEEYKYKVVAYDKYTNVEIAKSNELSISTKKAEETPTEETTPEQPTENQTTGEQTTTTGEQTNTTTENTTTETTPEVQAEPTDVSASNQENIQ